MFGGGWLQPSLDLPFSGTGVLDSRITFTRASAASYFDTAGVLQSASTNVARFDNNPSTSWTNMIRNNMAVGAVVGTPGTPPTFSGVFAANGMATNVVGVGTTADGIRYIDYQIVGTASSTFYVWAFDTVGAPALPGQIWTGSAYFALVGGSLANVTNLNLEQRITGGTPATIDVAFTPTATLTRVVNTTTLGGAATQAILALELTIVNGQAINFTLRVGMPQHELGSVVHAAVPTSGAIAGMGATPRGLLIEEARTNQFLQSGDFNNAAWNKGTCTLSAAVTAPDGTATARGVISNAGAIGFLSQAITSVAGTAITASCFFKAGTLTAGVILMPTAWWGDATLRFAVFTLTGSGVVASVSGGTATGAITQMANGWYRCSMTATPDLSASGIVHAARDNANGDGTAIQFYAWGAQIEAGAFPTSYIPTAGASATRAVDATSITSINTAPWFNQTNGTMAVEYMLEATNLGANHYLSELDIGNLNNRYALKAYGGVAGASFLTVTGGAATASINLASVIASAQKVAVAYTPTGQSGAANGGTVASTASAVPVGPLTTLVIGAASGPTNAVNAWISRVRYWPRALSSSELIAATT
jgi:hypothetical protein